MWKSHEGVIHLQSIHSMLGMMALSAYGVQFVTSFYIFWFAAIDLRIAFMPGYD